MQHGEMNLSNWVKAVFPQNEFVYTLKVLVSSLAPALCLLGSCILLCALYRTLTSLRPLFDIFEMAAFCAKMNVDCLFVKTFAVSRESSELTVSTWLWSVIFIYLAWGRGRGNVLRDTPFLIAFCLYSARCSCIPFDDFVVSSANMNYAPIRNWIVKIFMCAFYLHTKLKFIGYALLPLINKLIGIMMMKCFSRLFPPAAAQLLRPEWVLKRVWHLLS